MVQSIGTLAQKLISLTNFNSTEKNAQDITNEEWINGKFFSKDNIAAMLEDKMYTGLAQILERYTKLNRFSENYNLLVSLRDSFWEKYQINEDYLQMGMLISGLRIEIVHKFKGKKPELLRPEYWLMANSANDLAGMCKENEDFYPASGYYVVSGKYSLRFLQTLNSAKDLEKNYEKIKSCISFLRDSCEYRRDSYFFEEAAAELAERIARYKPKGEQFGRLLKSLQ